MQKYELSGQTHKMTIVLSLKHYKILLYTARIAHENTYDMRGKHNTYQLLTLIPKSRHLNFYDLIVQKYTHDPETHKMIMVLEYGHYNFMFDTARIGHENTYDMRGKYLLHA